MILIVSTPDDAHANLVEARLRERGSEVLRLDVADFPCGPRLTVELDSKDWKATLRDKRFGNLVAFGCELESVLSDVDAVWLRRAGVAIPDPTLSPEDRAWSRSETTALLCGLADTLRHRFWVNPLTAALLTDTGHGKLRQLERARACGLAIPRTIMTTDPDAARSFVRSCSEGAIYKPFCSAIRDQDLPDGAKLRSSIFTTRVGAEASFEDVAYAPCIFQEAVPKKVEIRATIMGDKVFAAEIHSQEDPRSETDWRAHQDGTRTLQHELPAEIAEKLRWLNGELGLVFGAADLIQKPDGSYVFLEVNQGGQFLWVEERTGQSLLENFCELLMQARADFVCDAPAHEPGLPRVEARRTPSSEASRATCAPRSEGSRPRRARRRPRSGKR